MKKIIPTIFLVIMILTVVGTALIPHQAQAGWWCMLDASCVAQKVGGFLVDMIFADLSNLILKIVSAFLSIAGIILNASIILTMNIKAVYEATPAIDQIWIIIRNLSSMFIIFGLIYTSILTILDIGSPNIKNLIKNIVIAGLLINFSLFFTKILIDGSNLISLQFYRAIAPDSQNVNLTKDSIGIVLGNSLTDGGISNVFMHSLKIPKIYNNNANKNGVLTDVNGGEYFKIIISTLAGALLMIFAALSFFAAAIMFVLRLVALLLLMGFSPLYFAGMIFPEIKKELSDKWEGHLKKQLIFMPVYLFFMYVALSFISSTGTDGGKGFFDTLGMAQSDVGAKKTEGGFMLSIIGIILQYTIAFILINIPLVAAIQLSGSKWAEKFTVQKAGKVIGGFVGQHTVGRAARAAGNAAASSKWASKNPNLAILTNKTLGKVSGASFGGEKGGYDKRVDNYSKERKDYVTKRYDLSAENKINIEQKTKTELKGQMDSWDARMQNNINTAQEKMSKNKVRVDASQVKVTEHEEVVAKLEKEHKEAVTVYGGETPLAQKAKTKLDDAKVKLEDEKQALSAVSKEAESIKEEINEATAKKSDEERKKWEDATAKILREKIREEERSKVSEEFAKQLDNDPNPFTREASEKAANLIRKELRKKPEDLELEKIINKLISDREEKKE
jgi:hypothetical protein